MGKDPHCLGWVLFPSLKYVQYWYTSLSTWHLTDFCAILHGDTYFRPNHLIGVQFEKNSHLKDSGPL